MTRTIEAELKYAVEDLGHLEKAIVSLGAVLKERRYEHDIYYNHPCRDFSDTDEAVRIRTVHSVSGVRPHSFITYKGPKIGVNMGKSRVEAEIGIDNIEDMAVFFRELGFIRVMGVNKKRTIYTLEDMSFCLDEVDGLGTFVEIEIICTEDELDKSVIKIRESAHRLELENDIRESYMELLMDNE